MLAMQSWWTRSSAPTSDQDDEAASPAASLSIDRGRIVQQGTQCTRQQGALDFRLTVSP